MPKLPCIVTLIAGLCAGACALAAGAETLVERTISFACDGKEGEKPYLVSAEPDRINYTCLLYTSDAADDLLCVDLGGRRIIKHKKVTIYTSHHHIITAH